MQTVNSSLCFLYDDLDVMYVTVAYANCACALSLISLVVSYCQRCN